MGWGDLEIELAKKIATRAQEMKSAGQISDAAYSQAIQDARLIEARGLQRKAESKSERFREGVTEVGKVAVGAVAGLLTGGPVGAVAGFVGAAAAGPGGALSPGGVAPAGIAPETPEGATPPIVPPGSVAAPAAVDKAPHPLLVLFALVFFGAFVLRKVLR
jgi:hypothetical protein